MLLIDVNVLVYAYREDAPNHTAYHSWLGPTSSALASPLVLPIWP